MTRGNASPRVMDGVVVIDKPKGVTSHDVVSIVKRRLGASKVGHLGTLDPNATGVLPLVINGATRFAGFLFGDTKEYLAWARLGETTDTYDVQGKVIQTRGVTATRGDVEKALEGFKGRITQIPPMYSAVKKGGTPLYKLARKGVTVERSPKEVEVFELELTGYDPPMAAFRVVCSAGTYVRTLCHDLGETLGCGAYLDNLRRTRSGPFLIDEAMQMDSPDLAKGIIPTGSVFERSFGRVVVDDRAFERLVSGATMVNASIDPLPQAGKMVIFVHNGRAIALAVHKGDGIFRVERFLADIKRRGRRVSLKN